jgi:hypothetical protein
VFIDKLNSFKLGPVILIPGKCGLEKTLVYTEVNPVLLSHGFVSMTVLRTCITIEDTSEVSHNLSLRWVVLRGARTRIRLSKHGGVYFFSRIAKWCC